VAKIRERLTVNEQGSHTFHMKSFNPALEDLDAEVEIITVWETIRISKCKPQIV
jgi:hypothetical protein